MPNETISPEVECLKLKAAINENHRLAQKAAADAIDRALLAGEQLAKWKELLPHGKFEVFVDRHFEGSLRTAQSYMKAAKELNSLPKSARVALLQTEDTLKGLFSRLKKDDSISEKGKPGGVAASLDTPPASTGPVTGEAADSKTAFVDDSLNYYLRSRKNLVPGEDERTEAQGQEAQETGSRPPRSGTDKAGTKDYGKCPNCAGTKWDVEKEGVSCSKCHHPRGEPVGDRAADEDPAETIRAKTVKTGEAFMRCFDDLQLLVPKSGTHKQCIELCKSLLKSAKGWK